MDRRRFLAGAGASLALGAGAGCGAVSLSRGGPPLPGVADLASLDMTGILHSLDSTLATIRSAPGSSDIVTPDLQRSIREDPRMDNIDSHTRDAFRSLFLVSSFRDMEEAVQAHPGVQARMLAGMDDMDSSVLGIHRAFKSLTPTERADAARAFREDAALRERVMTAIDTEALRSGASEARREHLRKVTETVSFRMRQSPSLFFDELDRRMEKVAERDLSVTDSERFLQGLMGPAAFEDKRARMTALAHAWQSVPGIAQPTQPVTAPGLATPVGGAPGPVAAPSTLVLPVAPGSILAPPGRIQPVGPLSYFEPPVLSRGTWTLRAGGMLLGMGLLHIGIGIGIIASGITIWGAVEMTHGALQLVGGIITLIVGGVQRSHRNGE